MSESMELTPMITVFIAVAILIPIGASIIGGANFVDCNTLENTNANYNWSKACEDIKSQTIDGYDLLGIVFLVIAAVIIIAVVRLLNSS